MGSPPPARLVPLDLFRDDDQFDTDPDVLYYPAAESRSRLTAPVIAVVFVCCLSAAGAATLPNRPSFGGVTNLFPITVPGFDQELGVTVFPLPPPGPIKTPIHLGGFTISPDFEQGLAYDDNVLGYHGSPASAISTTSASVGVNSNWSRDRLGAYLGIDNSTYLDTPKLSRTDVTAALGGGVTIGRGEADLAYSHLSLHEDPTTIGALPTSTPVPFQVDDVRADYNIPAGRLTVSPNLEYSQWRYGNTTIGGLPSDQRYRDRDVLQGGAALRYRTGEEWNLLATASAINAHYVHPSLGIAAPNSTSYLMMAGFDYQITGPVRVRALAGVEGRYFESSAYKQRTTPVGQLDIFWTPTGLTTVTGTLARSIEDPAQQDVGGLTLSRAEIGVDHELRRDLFLRGKIGGATVDYNQRANNQYNVYGSVGATWLINRSVQLLADYQYVWQSGSATTVNPTTGAPLSSQNFGRNIVSLKLRVAL